MKYISEDNFNSFEQLFVKIYKGNTVACDLSFCLLKVAHVWDDLIDKDTEVPLELINEAFLAATFELTLNPLWGTDLAHNLLNVYIRWRDANWLETNYKDDDNELSKAWMLRAGLYDLFILIAVKLFGLPWGLEISPLVRKFYGEKLVDFLKEIKYA